VGDNSGSCGEDWKCLKVPGRLNDGVGGMESFVGAFEGKMLFAGVWRVRARALGLRLGGVGGLTKDGDTGADVTVSLFPRARDGNAVDEAGRPSDNALEVLTARFFKFLGFFAGVIGRCNSKKGVCDASAEVPPMLLDRKSGTNDEGDAFVAGDSGEGPGEGSVIDAESKVDIVVVGDESLDSEADVDVLSLCW
jgi:hypothetical protein